MRKKREKRTEETEKDRERRPGKGVREVKHELCLPRPRP